MQTHLVRGAVLLLATAAASLADEPKSVLGQVLDAAKRPGRRELGPVSRHFGQPTV